MTSFVLLSIPSAKYLKAADSNGFSDPYLKILVSPVWPLSKKLITIKSQVIKKTCDPKWNFGVSILKGVTANDLKSLPTIKVEIWDKDLLTDDSLGYIEIPLANLATGPIASDFEVKPLKAGDDVSGTVSVACKFVELKSDPVLDAEVKEHSKFSLGELSKLQAEFKAKNSKAIVLPTELVNYLIKFKLLTPIFVNKMKNHGNLNEKSVQLLPEMYKDSEFMDFIAEGLFSSMDTDHNGVLDWSELIVGLSVLTQGNPEEEAKLKFQSMNKNNSPMTREQVTKLLAAQVRAKFSLLRCSYRIIVRIGTPKPYNHRKVWEKMESDKKIQNLLNYLECDKEHIKKIVDTVFEFADVDKSGTLSEDEFVRWSTNKEQDAIVEAYLDEVATPFIGSASESTDKLVEDFKSGLAKVMGINQ